MRGLHLCRLLLALSVLLVAAACADAAQLRSTSRRGLTAVMSADGFSLRPAGTDAQGQGDLAPVQLFEIVRPQDKAVDIGRLFTSCTCVALNADKTTFAAGERAILRLRNVQPTPPKGQMYTIYVQLNAPIRTILRLDTFVQSSQFIPAPPTAAPTRGNIKADGILAPEARAGDDIEIIVPKADNYIPDTSEYTLRKQAEKEALEKTASPESADAGDEKEPVEDVTQADDQASAGEEPPEPELQIAAAPSAGESEPPEDAAADPTPAESTALADEPAVPADENTAGQEAADTEVSTAAEEEAEAPEGEEPGDIETIPGDAIVEMDNAPRKPRFSDRVAARKEAMKRAMRSAEEMTDRAAARAAAGAAAAREGAAEVGGELWQKAKRAEGVVEEKAKAAGSAIGETAKSAAATATEKAKAAGAVIADKTGQAVDAVKETASDAVDYLKD